MLMRDTVYYDDAVVVFKGLTYIDLDSKARILEALFYVPYVEVCKDLQEGEELVRNRPEAPRILPYVHSPRADGNVVEHFAVPGQPNGYICHERSRSKYCTICNPRPEVETNLEVSQAQGS